MARNKGNLGIGKGGTFQVPPFLVFISFFLLFRSLFARKQIFVVFPTVTAILSFAKTFQCSIEALKTDRSASFRKTSAIACSIWKIPRPASASRALLRLTPCHQTYRRQRLALVSGIPGSLELTGGEYKTRERIHHSIADLWLLANPTSWGRVADLNPNLGYLSYD